MRKSERCAISSRAARLKRRARPPRARRMRAAAPRHHSLLPRRLPPLSGARASAAGARRAAAGRGGALFGRRCGSRAVGARAGRERVEVAAEANRVDSTGLAEGTGLDEGDTGPQLVLPGTERLAEYLASPAEGALSSAGVVLASLLLAFETLQLPPRLLYVADGLEVACLSLFTVEVGVNSSTRTIFQGFDL